MNIVHKVHENIYNAWFVELKHSTYVINSATNSRDLAQNLTRVRSSNLWGINISVKDRKSKFGDMVIQFKNPRGGPGDVYMYFDIPVTLFRRFQSATSKGHFFWMYIRNNFKYRKLTGDKRGKLPNAIN